MAYVDTFAGQVRMFAGDFAPVDWLLCYGQQLLITSYSLLYNEIGATFGGDGITTFALPDLRGRLVVRCGLNAGVNYALGSTGGVETITLTADQIPQHTHPLKASSNPATDTAPGGRILAQTRANRLYQTGAPSANLAAATVTSTGGSQPHTNMQPFRCLNFIIATAAFPPSGGDGSDALIGEVRPFPFPIAYNAGLGGWLPCDGQLLSIVDHPSLFAVIGTTYGGDGVTTFGVPDMRGRAAMHPGQGSGLTARTLNEAGGQEFVALTNAELPAHTHTLRAASTAGNTPAPKGHALARAAGAYQTDTTHNLTALAPAALSPYGSSSPHTNMMPFMSLGFYIATGGAMPVWP